MELFKKKDSRFYWYDFKLRGKRYRRSTKETNKKRATKIASLMLSQAMGGTGPLDRKAPSLQEFSICFLSWVESTILAAKSKAYYCNGWRLLSMTRIVGMRLDHNDNRTKTIACDFTIGSSALGVSWTTLEFSSRTFSAEWLAKKLTLVGIGRRSAKSIFRATESFVKSGGRVLSGGLAIVGLYSIGKGIYAAWGALTVSPRMKIRDLPPQIVALFDESVDEADEQGQPAMSRANDNRSGRLRRELTDCGEWAQ